MNGYVTVLQRNKPIGDRDRDGGGAEKGWGGRGRERIYFKELAHVNVVAGRSRICRADQSGNSVKS